MRRYWITCPAEAGLDIGCWIACPAEAGLDVGGLNDILIGLYILLV